ncbi:MAG: hypothetical protein HQL33_07325 [Alphaproteobacteria bacterium]|nr:hypothetical protein [Alphaproteobacteria bacterium]MBF0129788.1 hypothetical protein [Alphaproteobacteria bacterium]
MREEHHHDAWADMVRAADTHPPHRGALVRVGDFSIGAAGTRFLKPEDLDDFDVQVVLAMEHPVPWRFGAHYNLLVAPLPDYGGVPPEWPALVKTVIADLRAGRRVLAFCRESHGRTGCLLASLIAVLESAEETPDPILAVRERHCPSAVETVDQAIAIFDLRGRALPELYIDEFERKRRMHGG